MNNRIVKEITRRVEAMPEEDQAEVLQIIKSMGQTGARLETGAEFGRRVAGLFSREDAEEMMRAIEEDCERIDLSRW